MRGSERWFRWGRVLLGYFTMQGLTQAFGMVSGLLVVRWLNTDELALYTLAASVATFFSFATDFGATGSLVYFFHQSMSTDRPFAPMVRAVLSLRRWAFLAGAVIVLAGFPWVALRTGFAASAVAGATVAILFGVWFQLGMSMHLLLLRLENRFRGAYIADLGGNTLRLGVTLALRFLGGLNAWSALCASVLGSALTSALARRREAPVPALVGESPAEKALARRRVLRYLAPTLPGGLYFSTQGALVVWLATAFGGTTVLAEVGAMGRLGVVVGLVSSLSGIVLLPKLARISDEHQYRLRTFQFAGLLAALAGTILAVAIALPEPFLFLIGERYRDLGGEFAIVVAAAGLRLLGGFFVSLNGARSWTRWTGAIVLIEILVQAGWIYMLRLDTTASVLWFGVLTAALGLALQLAVTLVGFTRPERVRVVA